MEVLQEKKLNFTRTLRDGIKLGITNFIPLFLTTLLWIITVWIPYLNVGTTIGLIKVIISISKGEKIDPVSIFSKENFNPFGDFFILMGLLSIGITAATCFMIVPGIVLGMAWGMAIYLFLDKGTSPTESITLSYKITMGEKWKMFLIVFVFGLILSLVSGLFGLIPKVGVILALIITILGSAILVAIEAVIYKQLVTKLDPQDKAAPAPAAEIPAEPAE